MARLSEYPYDTAGRQLTAFLIALIAIPFGVGAAAFILLAIYTQSLDIRLWLMSLGLLSVFLVLLAINRLLLAITVDSATGRLYWADDNERY